MPSFTVTAAGQKIQLDPTGAGQAQYTVTNTSSDTVSGRLIATPQEPAKSEWFSIGGESTREFAPGAAEQVLLQVRVPAGTAAGPYSVRLDAVSEANPDEDFTEGPSVSFDVAPPAAKPPWWKKWWWVILIAVVVLLIVIGVVVWLLVRGNNNTPTPTTSATPTVPSVVGMLPIPAEDIIKNAGYGVTTVSRTTFFRTSAGHVVTESPPAGSPLVLGSTVTLGVGVYSPLTTRPVITVLKPS